jgi:hypothetical protein
MFLDVPPRKRSAYVYRVLSLDRLYQLFASGQNVLVSPAKWEDPFENFILKSQRISRHGWFGQCWTRQRASDAMWRIYSPDKKGVRIRSTPALLMASMSKVRGGHGFVGTVQYLPKKPLMRFAVRALAKENLAVISHAAETLLVKRPAFRHEAEVRLLWHAAQDSADGLFRYAVDPHALVDQIMIDPRLPIGEYYRTKAAILKKTGYEGQITRSLIYAPPPQLLPASESVSVARTE